MAESPVASSSSKDNFAVELTTIRAILELLAQYMNVVKGDVESSNVTVNYLGSRVEEAETRISRLEDEEELAQLGTIW